MLREPPASNALAAIFKNADFSYSSLKVAELSDFWQFFLLKIILSLLMLVPSSPVNMERLKDGSYSRL